jgi:hypothetical protein
MVYEAEPVLRKVLAVQVGDGRRDVRDCCVWPGTKSIARLGSGVMIQDMALSCMRSAAAYTWSTCFLVHRMCPCISGSDGRVVMVGQEEHRTTEMGSKGEDLIPILDLLAYTLLLKVLTRGGAPVCGSSRRSRTKCPQLLQTRSSSGEEF